MGEPKKEPEPKKEVEKPWWESEWFLEWERLAKRDYHGKIGA